MFPSPSAYYGLDYTETNIKLFSELYHSVFPRRVQMTNIKNIFFCKFGVIAIFSLFARIVKSPVAFYTQSLKVFDVPMVLPRYICPFKLFRSFCFAVLTIFWATVMLIYPYMNSVITCVISFPCRTVLTSHGTLMRTKLSPSFFYFAEDCSKFFVAGKTIFNNRHINLTKKYLCSTCSEVTVKLLTLTKRYVVDIKNPPLLNRISIT